MRKWLDELLVILLIQLFLFSLTSIDYIVHHTLYNYGLIFSHEWADIYWFLLFLTFQSVALVAMATYWLNRENPRKLTALTIWLTITAEHFGGFLDTLWFIFYFVLGDPLSNAITNWWWMYQSRIFGFWNLLTNIIYNIIWLIPLVYLWYRIGFKNKFRSIK